MIASARFTSRLCNTQADTSEPNHTHTHTQSARDHARSEFFICERIAHNFWLFASKIFLLSIFKMAVYNWRYGAVSFLDYIVYYILSTAHKYIHIALDTKVDVIKFALRYIVY